MRKIYLGNSAPIHYEKNELGEATVQKADQPRFETVTEIVISPDSTLSQALAEVLTIWDIHSHDDAPDWVGHNAGATGLAILLAEHYEIADIRPMDGAEQPAS